MSYTFLAPGFIPLIEAVCRLAFGDNDYIRHLTEEVPAANILGAGAIGRLQAPRESCPEVDAPVSCIFGAARAGKIKVVALRWETQQISEQYEPIPKDFFLFNQWTIGWPGDFPLYKPYDRETGTGGPDVARWRYPAVESRAIERLYANSASGRGSDADVNAAVAEYLCAVKASGGNSNMDDACNYVLSQDRLPKARRDRVREVYREQTGRSAADRGRPKIATK